MSIRYSQDFKDSLVKLHQESRSLKSLAEEFALILKKWTIFIQSVK